MFGKKREKEETSGVFSALFASLILGPLFAKIQDFFVDLFSSAREATEGYLRRIVQGLVVAVGALVGVIFVLIGVAQYVSGLYGRPGLGEMIVGGGILLISLVWYFIPGKRN